MSVLAYVDSLLRNSYELPALLLMRLALNLIDD